MVFDIILSVSIICILFMALYDLVFLLSEGWYIKKEVRDKIESKLNGYTRLNMYNEDILTGNGLFPYISKSSGITYGYYIGDIGAVPRWTSLSREIRKRHKKIKSEQSKKAEAIKSFYND